MKKSIEDIKNGNYSADDLLGITEKDADDLFSALVSAVKPEDFNKEFWECKLKPFLINRSENKPKQLDTEEASAIFDLAEVLYFTLDDYLDIIEKLPVMKISQHSLIIHNLNNDNELFSKFTASQIGRIILLMLKHYTPDASWVLYNADELLGKITPSIEQNQLKEIRKKAKQHALSWQIKV
jgi:hypothetical protein